MISPPTLRTAVNLAAAAADTAGRAATPAAGRAATSRATYVPSDPALPTIIGGAAPSVLAKARRSATTRVAGRARTVRSSGAGYAKAAAKATTTKTTKATTSKNDPLSFLKDPKLSIEEKLMRLLGYLNQKWEKEMQAKMDQIAAGEGTATSSSSSKSASTSSSKKGGLLGSIGSVLKGALGPAGIAFEALKIPAVRSMLAKVGGPVLAAGATALGFPQAAPLLLKHGPAIVEAAAGLASSLDGADAKSAGSGAGASSAGSGTKKMSDSEQQMVMMDIQRIKQKQQEMFGLVSGILKSSHDTRMSVINNIR